MGPAAGTATGLNPGAARLLRSKSRDAGTHAGRETRVQYTEAVKTVVDSTESSMSLESLYSAANLLTKGQKCSPLQLEGAPQRYNAFEAGLAIGGFES